MKFSLFRCGTLYRRHVPNTVNAFFLWCTRVVRGIWCRDGVLRSNPYNWVVPESCFKCGVPAVFWCILHSSSHRFVVLDVLFDLGSAWFPSIVLGNELRMWCLSPLCFAWKGVTFLLQGWFDGALVLSAWVASDLTLPQRISLHHGLYRWLKYRPPEL